MRSIFFLGVIILSGCNVHKEKIRSYLMSYNVDLFLESNKKMQMTDSIYLHQYKDLYCFEINVTKNGIKNAKTYIVTKDLRKGIQYKVNLDTVSVSIDSLLETNSVIRISKMATRFLESGRLIQSANDKNTLVEKYVSDLEPTNSMYFDTIFIKYEKKILSDNIFNEKIDTTKGKKVVEAVVFIKPRTMGKYQLPELYYRYYFASVKSSNAEILKYFKKFKG